LPLTSAAAITGSTLTHKQIKNGKSPAILFGIVFLVVGIYYGDNAPLAKRQFDFSSACLQVRIA
jgi:hypothetical protein